MCKKCARGAIYFNMLTLGIVVLTVFQFFGVRRENLAQTVICVERATHF